MAGSTERLQDAQESVWPFEPADPAPAPSWLQRLKTWQRWPVVRRPRRHSDTDATAQDHLRGEATTLPEHGRGQALRAAHRALRERMRTQRGLREVLPHLFFIERALAQKGSVALLELPVWVLQRGLQQLSRLPADSLDERALFSVLQQRLVEAIATRSGRTSPPPARADSPDSFMGGLDSQLGHRSIFSTLPGGLEVSEVPHSVYDDVLQDRLHGRDEAANTPD